MSISGIDFHDKDRKFCMQIICFSQYPLIFVIYFISFLPSRANRIARLVRKQAQADAIRDSDVSKTRVPFGSVSHNLSEEQ